MSYKVDSYLVKDIVTNCGAYSMRQHFLVCPNEQEFHNIETTRGKKRCSLHKYNGKQKYWSKIAHVATTQTDIFVATHKK